MVPILLCTFVAHIIFLHVFFLSPFLLSLSLSPFLSIYVSLWLQDTCHLMPFTKQHSAYAWVVTSILFLINLTFPTLSLHSSYKIHQPFTNYFLTTTLLRAAWKTSFSLSGQPSSSYSPHEILPAEHWRCGAHLWMWHTLRPFACTSAGLGKPPVSERYGWNWPMENSRACLPT